MSNIIAIPDIHGRWDLLQEAWLYMEKVWSLDPAKDHIVFLGDMIDRGPQSREVVEFIKSLTEQFPENVIALKGNHEQFAIDCHEGAHMGMWHTWLLPNNGGKKTMESFKDGNWSRPGKDRFRIPNEIIDWFSSRPVKHIHGRWFFSHAPIGHDRRLDTVTERELIWNYFAEHEGRAELDMRGEYGLTGVCGHIHALQNDIWTPRLYDHYYYMDAGCGCHPDASLFTINLTQDQLVRAGFGNKSGKMEPELYAPEK